MNLIAGFCHLMETRSKAGKASLPFIRRNGELTGTPADIGKLIREVPADIRRECEEEIKQILFDWAWSKIARGVTAGLPEWYKQRITERMSDE